MQQTLDLLRSLGLHRFIAAPAPGNDAGRGKSCLVHEVTGMAVPSSDIRVADVEASLALLASSPVPLMSHELSPRLVCNPPPSAASQTLAEQRIALMRAIKDNSATDVFRLHAGIVSARASLFLNAPTDAIETILQHFGSPSDPRGLSTLTSSRLMYSYILVLIAYCTLGQGYIATGKVQEAEQAFQAAVDQKPFQPPSITDVNHPELQRLIESETAKVDQWTFFSEEALYYLIGVQRELKNHARVLELCNKYIQQFKNLPISFKPINRATIIRAYLTTLSEIMPSLNITNGSTPDSFESLIGAHPLAPFTPVFSNPYSGLRAFSIIQPPPFNSSLLSAFQSLLPQYEALCVHVCPFPRMTHHTGEQAALLTELDAWRHARVVECFEWTAISDLCGESPTVLDTIDRGYKSIETIYRATKHTFQNLRILRTLAVAFASLLGHLSDSACETEVQESLLAVSAYLSLYAKRRDFVESEARKVENGPSFDGVVEGETVANVCGVLVAGIRTCLDWYDGTDDKLKSARNFIDTAESLLNTIAPLHHDPTVVSNLSRQIYKYKGLVYGTLASEVTESGYRRTFQQTALEAFQKCLETSEGTEDAWRILYEVAYLQSEMGEITAAILTLQKSLTLNSNSTNSWTLLSVLLHSCRQTTQALQACEAGWKQGIEVAQLKGSSVVSDMSPSETSGTQIILWDSVPVKVKEDLFNLKLTELSIIEKISGPKAALESLQPLFSLFSRMFGPLLKSLDAAIPNMGLSTPVAYSYASSEASTNKESPRFLRSDKLPGTPPLVPPHSRGSTDVPSSSGTPRTPPYFGYSFRLFDLQTCLWMTAASLYTRLTHTIDAGLALSEAEQVAKTWVLIDEKVRLRDTLLFSTGVTSNIAGGEATRVKGEAAVPLPLKKSGTRKWGSRMGLPGDPTKLGGSGKSDVSLSKQWGMLHICLRRVLADITFGHAMLKLARYTASLTPPRPLSFAKYMPILSNPVEPTTRDKLSRKPSYQSMLSLTQKAHNSTSSVASVKGSTSPANGSSLSVAAATGGRAPNDSGEKMSVNSGVGRSNSPASFASQAPSTKPSAVQEEPVKSIETIINDLHICLALDQEHLPSKIELARLYSRKQETMAQAEFWFEQACKSSKVRGSSGGARGLATYFGGLTSAYGYECWVGLADVLKTAATDEAARFSRLEAAKECLFYAVELERSAVVRGVQCLPRKCE